MIERNHQKKSKRIQELHFQLNRLKTRLEDLDKLGVRQKLDLIKRLRSLILQCWTQRAMEAPNREEAEKILAKAKKDFPHEEVSNILPYSEISPMPEGYVTGEEALQVVPYPDKKFYEAVRHYSADTTNPQSYYRLINSSLRTPPKPLTNPAVIRVRNQLLEMFKEAKPIEKPIRIYRGVPEWLADDIITRGAYLDNGFCSCSVDLGVAVAYSGKNKSILVIDIPENTNKAVRIGDISRNAHEREVLLQNGIPLELVESKMTTEGFQLIYLTYTGDL